MGRLKAAPTYALAALLAWATAASAAIPLVDAAREGNSAAVHALLERRADVNAADADGTTALHWAAHRDDVAMAEALLKRGASPNIVSRHGATPLSTATRLGSARMLSLLLDNGADVRTATTALADGQTLLMLATRTGRVDAM